MRPLFKPFPLILSIILLEFLAIEMIRPLRVSASSLVQGAYNLILQGGSALTREPTLNFIGGTNSSVSCADNAGATRTDCTFNSSGGGTGTPGFVESVSSQTSLTVAAATHNQGTNPVAFCFDNATPANFVLCSYTVSGTGTVVFGWNPAFSGTIVIQGATGGFTNPMTGADQYIGSNGNSSGTASFGQWVTCGTSTTSCAYSIITHLWSSLTNVTQATGDATVATATDQFVASALASVNPAVAVQAATTGVLSNTPTYNNGTAGVGATLTAGSNGVLTIDGYSPVLNDRVLIKNQAAALQNGVYTLTTVGTGGVPYVLTRATDYNSTTNINYTGTIPVLQGSTNANTGWNLTNQISAVGTSTLSYTQAPSGSSGGPPGGNVKATGNLATGDIITGAGGKTIQDSGTALTSLKQIYTFGGGFLNSGSALVAGGSPSLPMTAPAACTIIAWDISIGGTDSGTATVKFLKVASGTASPTLASNSINTSGVALSSGTHIHSTTLSDFTTTSVAAGDIIAVALTASATNIGVSASFQCQ